jgi:hypothetical protein
MSAGFNPFGLLQDALAYLFYRYGMLICRNPTPFIMGPVILTSILSLGIFNFNVSVGFVRRAD